VTVLRVPVRPLRTALPLAACLAALASAAPAAADVVAVSAAPSTVGRGGTLVVRFQPTGAADDMTFHQASFSVLRPGRPCPVDGVVPAGDAIGGGGSGPFRASDPPIDAEMTVPDDAVDGTYTVCTWTADVALSLVGEPVPGPTTAVEVRGGAPLRSEDPDTDADPDTPGTVPGTPGPGGGSATRRTCVISPGVLRRSRVSRPLRIRCRGVRGRIRIRFTRPGGTVSYRLRTLRRGRTAVRVGQVPAGRSHVAVLRAGRVLGERAIRVR
jgi:hypothetical protein